MTGTFDSEISIVFMVKTTDLIRAAIPYEL